LLGRGDRLITEGKESSALPFSPYLNGTAVDSRILLRNDNMKLEEYDPDNTLGWQDA